jgi:hypothetical protein
MNTDLFGVCLEPECNEEQQPELPSFTDMAKGLLGSVTDILGGALQGEGVLVEENVYLNRLNICKGCEFFRHEDARCSKCGCFMEAKTRFVKTTCPIQKW